MRPLVLAVLAFVASAAAQPTYPGDGSVNGPTCRRGVTKTFWVPCTAEQRQRWT